MKIVGAVFKEKKNEFITLPDGWTVETTAGELGTTLTDEVGNLTIALNTQFLVLSHRLLCVVGVGWNYFWRRDTEMICLPNACCLSKQQAQDLCSTAYT